MSDTPDQPMTTIEGKTFVGPSKRTPGDDNAHWVPHDYLRYVHCQFDARQAAEAVKLSGRSYVRFEHCHFIGGYEDCADLVNCSHITFYRCSFFSRRTRQHVTCKGTGTGNRWTSCRFEGRGTHGTVIDLGQHVTATSNRGGYLRNTTVEDCTVTERNLSLVRSWRARGITTRNNRGRYFIRHLSMPWPVWRMFWFVADRI